MTYKSNVIVTQEHSKIESDEYFFRMLIQKTLQIIPMDQLLKFVETVKIDPNDREAIHKLRQLGMTEQQEETFRKIAGSEQVFYEVTINI